MTYDPFRRPVVLLAAMLVCAFPLSAVWAGDAEFTGKFEPALAADREDLDRVVFKPVRDRAKLKLEQPVDSDVSLTVGWLFDARTEKSSIQTLLVDSSAETPYLVADVDTDGSFEAAERVDLEQESGGAPNEWNATIALPIEGGPFTAAPLFVQYLHHTRWEGMNEGERLVLESHSAYARGIVDIAGRKTLVQYGFSPRSKKIDIMNGTLGVDSNGDGAIDSDRFSAESATANAEVVVFRVGTTFVSTKKTDVAKNLIVMRSHQAADYKRVELAVGTVMPDFEFTDFDGKKHRFSEYRGKIVLLDFWGMWCPPCRAELPHLKAAYSKFQPRGFEIVGMNTDEIDAVPQVKKTLRDNGMDWVQAKRESIEHVIRALRISSFPTTVLVGADGRVLSLNNTLKGQPGLRGQELVETIEGALPQ